MFNRDIQPESTQTGKPLSAEVCSGRARTTSRRKG
ncbi:hypothetical protein GN244_ATG06470 [Phytophthora infestans]|uniref:Uncharacterized protein n=1 Tax=Phytophthora infestans TaxID=4787 RepID=A0A833TEL0_PHYIN|nr:hypothetical protein GN244_ATG06470 [Phytophthora infestans]